MFNNFDPDTLRHDRNIRYYFRYPLNREDFFEIRERHRLLGIAAAKPLYGRLTPKGEVDRSGGFNGRIAIIFLPARSRNPRRARLFFTTIPKKRITTPRHTRNWKAIHAAAEREVKKQLSVNRY